MQEQNFEKICMELQEYKQQTNPQSLPEIFGIQNKEIYITQWLGYILDPNKNGLGTAPLNALLRAGNYNETLEETDKKEIRVYTEYVFDNHRRIDLFIDTPICIIGIENKIWSDEQINQTEDYTESMKKIANATKKIFCIYLYPELNTKNTPNGAFHNVTYTEFVKKLKYIEKIDCNKRSQWILKEFIKYVEENLMEKYPKLTANAKTYSENLSVIISAQEEFNNFVENVEAWLLKKLPKPFISYKNKINNGWWAIIKSEKWENLFFHYEILWSKTTPLALAKELLIVIHLETKEEKIVDYFETHSKDKWKQVNFNGIKTYTLFQNQIDCNFENQYEAEKTLGKIIEKLNSDDFEFWTKIAENYINDIEMGK